MNILLLTYQGGIAGSTLSIYYLARGLANRGHVVYLGCRENTLLYQLLENTNVNLIPIPFKSKLDFHSIKLVRDITLEYQIDIVNAQSSIDRYVSIFAKILFGLKYKLVHTRRQTPKSSGGIFQAMFYTLFTDKIVAVSRGVKKSLAKMGIPKRHIEVIFNGTPKEKYQNLSPAQTEHLRKKLGIDSGSFVIGCVSRRKRQEQIIQALPLLDFDARVVFIGINRDKIYEKLISHLNIKNPIHFCGRVPTDEILNYYKLFDVHVLPSVTEGLSQTLLEAMAIGVPVIATAAAGNLDLITEQQNGLLFTDGDIKGLAAKINSIKQNPDQTKKMIKNARKTALEDFSIDNTITNYESFFKRLCNSKK